YMRWSPSQMESKPTSSAARASVTYSVQATRRSTSGSWIPTRSGRTRRLLELDDAADDLGLLHRVEGFVDLGEVDAARDHALEVELALPPQPEQHVEVGADVGGPVPAAQQLPLEVEELERVEGHLGH